MRNSRQLGADHVHITGRHWPQTLGTILSRVTEGLGVTDAIEAEFYKLLIYDQGGFFVGHRDSEKSAGMFATLVIALPSESTGGELLVRHKGRELRFDLRADDPGEVAFAAFYADCVHEVRPITTGYRVTLIYNLLRRAKGQTPEPPEYADQQTRLAALLRTWSEDQRDAEADLPTKLVYPLAHAYTPADVGFAALKGADAATAGVLSAAADQADCALHLALLTVEETGTAEYAQDYDRRRSWSRDDGPHDEFEAGEVDDWSITLANWRTRDGSPASWGKIPVSKDELSPPDPFDAMEPDELRFQEATGNAGVSFERTYRRGALVLWPNFQTMAVLTQAGLAVTVPHMGDLAQRWQMSGMGEGSPLWQQAHDLASDMIADWPRNRQAVRADGEETRAAGFLAALTRLGDTERIEDFLTDLLTGLGAHRQGSGGAGGGSRAGVGENL